MPTRDKPLYMALSEAERAQILLLYLMGVRLADIESLIGVSKTVIYQVLYDHYGLDPSRVARKRIPGRRRITKELEQKILELYEKYRSGNRVADELGLPRRTVYNVLQRHGYKRSTTGENKGRQQ